MTLRVGIVGAGIGGLATATALARKGFKVQVFERATQFTPKTGAGFGLSPNGQVCLASLGLHRQTQAILHRFDRLARLDKLGQVQRESSVMRQLLDKYGFTVCGCLRADLVDLLASQLDAGTNLIKLLYVNHT